MKKTTGIFIIVALMMSLQSLDTWADNVNGISYQLSGNEATVVSFVQEKQDRMLIDPPRRLKEEYSGDVVIPSTITYKGKTYNVTGIKKKAFERCANLNSLTISEGVKTIGEEAFTRCTSLRSATISEGVTTIGNRAFYRCQGLSSVTLPSTLKSIGNDAFLTGYSDVKFKLTSDGRLTDIKNMLDVEKVIAIIFTQPCTAIDDHAFSAYKSLTEIDLPSTLTSIGDFAFENCTGLTSIAIPRGVTTIGYGAFSGCKNLKSVTIPASVTTIKNEAFKGCADLKSITILNPTPVAVNSAVFHHPFKSVCILYVPAASVSLYKAADVWKEFKIMALEQ